MNLKDKYKNIVLLFVTFFIFGFFNVVNASEEMELYLECDNKYNNSDEVTVYVKIKNVNSAVVGLTWNIEYDNSKLEFKKAKPGQDLKSTFDLAEEIPEKSCVAMGFASLGGITNDGTYYLTTFKVLDDKEDIDVNLRIKECTDSKGNDIAIKSTSSKIVIVNEESTKVIEKSKSGQKINSFNIENKDEIPSIQEIIINEGKINLANDDDLVYELDGLESIEVLSNGTVIANKDGKTNVRVKLNDEIIGNLEVEVKDGKVISISGNEEIKEFDVAASTENGNAIVPIDDGKDEIEVVDNKESNYKKWIYVGLIILVIIIFVIIYKFIRKNGAKTRH